MKTGRMKPGQPNLQNIPIRTAEGRRVRDAFARGPVLVGGDYAEVERALLARVSPEDREKFFKREK